MTKRPQTQDVHDDAPAGKYFTQILNMADDDLDPYEYRLLGHYKRVIGELNAPCTQGTRLIAEICRMSLGKVTAVRKQLEEKGWIRCERRPNNTIRVTLIDRMAENVARYSKRSQDEQARSPHEHGVRHMNTTVHDVNEEITRTPTKEQSIPIGIEPTAKAAATNGAKPTPKPRKRNAMFDAIVMAFGYDAETLTKNESSLIGTVAAQLTTAQVTPEDVASLYAWCKRQGWKRWGPGALTTNVSNWRKTARPNQTAHPASDWETFA